MKKWLDNLLFSGWIAGFGVGGVMIVYGAPALYPSSHIGWPNLVSPGTVVWVLNWPVRVALFATVLTAFMLRLMEHRTVPPEERLTTLARLLRAHSDTAALGVLCIVVLGGVREVMQAELYENDYGRNLYAGPLDPRELAGAAALSAAAVFAFVAMGLAKLADPARDVSAFARPVPTPSPSRATRTIVVLLIVAVWVRAARFGSWTPQDRHNEALTMEALTWESILAAFVLAADDPVRCRRRFREWLERNLAPLRLLVLLELLRVAGREEWSLDMQWLPPHSEHAPERLLFFAGRLDHVAALAWHSVFLAGAIVVLLAHLRRKEPRHAAVDAVVR